MRSIISLLKLLTFILISFITMPLLLLSGQIFKNSPAFHIGPRTYHRLVCFIYNIKTVIKGAPDTTNRVIFVGNHLSYIDIPVIGSTLPATFIAKADVRKWPIFGILSALAETVFIERSREAAIKCIADIKSALQKERSLILFPEGTSTQGIDVSPFKSSIFDLFLNDDLKEKIIIQPFTISILETNGRPVAKPEDHDLYAWYGDMTMLPHLWAIGKSKGVKILVAFHNCRPASDYDNRKIFAKDCHNDVLKGLNNSFPETLDLKIKSA